MDKAAFLPGIWDRLMAAGHGPAYQSLAQLHASIARDLEDLFNTRLALPADTLDRYKACRQTILNFGLVDFAALCLGSSEDQHIICAYVTETINRFEPLNDRAAIRIGLDDAVAQAANTSGHSAKKQIEVCNERAKILFDIHLDGNA